MATLKQRLHRKSDSGTYDVIHLETSADIVEYDENNSIKDIIENVSATASAAYSEIPSLKSSVSEGKRQVASAITDRGISTASDASFSTMAANIRKIEKTITGIPALNKDFTYSGNCEVIDDSTAAYNEWRIKFLTSGTLKFTAKVAVDIFLVGGGAGGACGYSMGNGSNSTPKAAGGGGSGYTKTLNNITLAKDTSYAITIGNGGNGSTSKSNPGGSGGTTSIASITNGSVSGGSGGNGGSSIYPYIGGNGGSGGGAGTRMIGGGRTAITGRSAGGTNGGNGGQCPIYGQLAQAESHITGHGDGTVGTGQGSTTKEFGDSGSTLYATGGRGGGYTVNSVGTAQILAPNSPIANSGNGGDGGYSNSTSAVYLSGSGSSGILIIRKHKT